MVPPVTVTVTTVANGSLNANAPSPQTNGPLPTFCFGPSVVVVITDVFFY